MAERASPLAFPPLSGAVAITPLPPQARLLFRGREAAVAAIAAPLGFALPRQPCRAASGADRAALWLGPDEWLILAPAAEAAALFAACEAATAGLPHALTDISHRQTAILVCGTAAEAVLNAGCPLDLRGGTFPVGMCTRTLLGKAEIVLWRIAPQTFRVEIWRSFADYLWRILEDAAREWMLA